MHPILKKEKYISFRAKPDVPLHDSGYKLIEDINGDVYDFLSIKYAGVDSIIGDLRIDIDKDGWIKIWDDFDSDITSIKKYPPLQYTINTEPLTERLTDKKRVQSLIYMDWEKSAIQKS